MTWLDFVVLIFAASAIVDVWKNGSLFADWRAFFESDPVAENATLPPATDDITLADQRAMAGLPPLAMLPWPMRWAERFVPRFVGELLTCSFCLSHHTPWLVGVVFFLPALFAPWQWLAFLLKLPAYSLAATRIGNLINAWAPSSAKYEHDTSPIPG